VMHNSDSNVCQTLTPYVKVKHVGARASGGWERNGEREAQEGWEGVWVL
jgi:hypothetical protein